jgi:dTDP-4-amino-4,6-dideoxygalactose transaminase
MVERFEQRWAQETGVEHAVAVTSGTSALLLALRACGIGEGDEVVTTPLTFPATVGTILEAGAVARFADVDEHGTMDPRWLERVVTDRTRAILPVHLYGLAADMPRITAFAAHRGLTVVEDAAQAAGARAGGSPVGSFGVGCFSFYATKNLTTGEGGMVTTSDGDVAERVRMLRNHGRGAGGGHVTVGHNYRMTDLQAAIGLAQCDTLGVRNDRRRKNAAVLNEGLHGLAGLALPVDPPGRTSSYSLYTVRVTHQAPIARGPLVAALRQLGVDSGVYYPRLVYEEPAFRDHPRVIADPAPAAKTMSEQVLSLPVHPGLSESDLRHIIEAVRRSLT